MHIHSILYTYPHGKADGIDVLLGEQYVVFCHCRHETYTYMQDAANKYDDHYQQGLWSSGRISLRFAHWRPFIVSHSPLSAILLRTWQQLICTSTEDGNSFMVFSTLSLHTSVTSCPVHMYWCKLSLDSVLGTRLSLSVLLKFTHKRDLTPICQHIVSMSTKRIPLKRSHYTETSGASFISISPSYAKLGSLVSIKAAYNIDTNLSTYSLNVHKKDTVRKISLCRN